MSRFLRMSYLAACIGGIGFFAMSVLLLGVWPGAVLDRQIRATQSAHPLPLSPSESRGREVYSREGCAYCHTQQIRYLASDTARFGRATLAWETIFDYPHLWGTRRIGPDLSRESGVRPADWQLAHLYSPKLTVADSVMPAYPWLFDGMPERPTQSARDVVAYLDTLGRDRALAGPEGEAHARAACNCSADEAHFAFDAPELNASPAAARRTGPHPALAAVADSPRGHELYAHNCASCHGPDGRPSDLAGPLSPQPASLEHHVYSLDRLGEVLWNGVAGSAMPAWRDLPPADLSALAATVRSCSLPQREGVSPTETGSRVYADHCAQCHGETGAGDGPAASQLPIAPTNFKSQRPSPALSLHVLRVGVQGTRMAPWASKLNEAELGAVADYVRTFFRPDAPAPSR